MSKSFRLIFIAIFAIVLMTTTASAGPVIREGAEQPGADSVVSGAALGPVVRDNAGCYSCCCRCGNYPCTSRLSAVTTASFGLVDPSNRRF
jgi:hypothetical protein